MPISADDGAGAPPGSPASPLPGDSSQRVAGYLVATGITAGYQRLPVIHDVNLQVGRGEVVLVMGPNGAGKSTLVKALVGQLPLMAGSVVLDQGDISHLKDDTRAARGVGYVPQSGDVFPTLTVLDNLEMGGYRLPKKEVKPRLEEIFEIFPMLAALRRRRAGTLSGGERKTLGIARALVPKPVMLILDEPTSNLAPLVAANVLEAVVGRLAADSCAVLLIEQRVTLGLEVATWGYVLTEGRVRMSASSEQLGSTEDLAALFLNTESAASRDERERHNG
ncbi:MAG TPA: ABC transporter ATP-binding protein [Acidimicrobiales bacterium]|nr:ABC transporter ATP-binding protein [Acidimicrobiales bacterium]